MKCILQLESDSLHLTPVYIVTWPPCHYWICFIVDRCTEESSYASSQHLTWCVIVWCDPDTDTQPHSSAACHWPWYRKCVVHTHTQTYPAVPLSLCKYNLHCIDCWEYIMSITVCFIFVVFQFMIFQVEWHCPISLFHFFPCRICKVPFYRSKFSHHCYR